MAIRTKSSKIPVLRDIIDKDTGEVKRVTDYINLTEMDLGNWFKIMRVGKDAEKLQLQSLGIQFMIFYVLLERTIWTDCTVEIGPVCKDVISNLIVIKHAMIMKYVKLFVKGKLLKKLTGNSYMINPRFFYIGAVENQIKMIQKYHANGTF